MNPEHITIPGEYGHHVDPFHEGEFAPRIPDAHNPTGTHVARSVYELKLSMEEIVAILESQYSYDAAGGGLPLTSKPDAYAPWMTYTGQMVIPAPESMVGPPSPPASISTLWISTGHRLEIAVKSVQLYIVHLGSFTTNYKVYMRAKWTATLVLYFTKFDKDGSGAGVSWVQDLSTDPQPHAPEDQRGYGPGVELEELFLIRSDRTGVPVSYEVGSVKPRTGDDNFTVDIVSDESGNDYIEGRVVSSGIRLTNLKPLSNGLWFSRRIPMPKGRHDMIFFDGECDFAGSRWIPQDFDVFQQSVLGRRGEFPLNDNEMQNIYEGAVRMYRWGRDDPSLTPPESYTPQTLHLHDQSEGPHHEHLGRLKMFRFWDFFGKRRVDVVGDMFDLGRWAVDRSFQSGSISDLSRSMQFNLEFKTPFRGFRKFERFFIDDYKLSRTEGMHVDWHDFAETAGMLNGGASDTPFEDHMAAIGKLGYLDAEDLGRMRYIATAFDVSNSSWIPPRVFTVAGRSYAVPWMTYNFVDQTTSDDTHWRVGDPTYWMTVDLNRYGWESGDRFLGYFPLVDANYMPDLVSMTFPEDSNMTVICLADIDISSTQSEKEPVVRLLLDTVTNFEVNKDQAEDEFKKSYSHSETSTVVPHHAYLHQVVAPQLNSAVSYYTGLQSPYTGLSSHFSNAARSSAMLGTNNRSSTIVTGDSIPSFMGAGTYDPYGENRRELEREEELERFKQMLKDKAAEAAQNVLTKHKGPLDKIESFLEGHTREEELLGLLAYLGYGGLGLLLGGGAAEAVAGAAGEVGEAVAGGTSSIGDIANAAQDLQVARTRLRDADLRGAMESFQSARDRLRSGVGGIASNLRRGASSVGAAGSALLDGGVRSAVAEEARALAAEAAEAIPTEPEVGMSEAPLGAELSRPGLLVEDDPVFLEELEEEEETSPGPAYREGADLVPNPNADPLGSGSVVRDLGRLIPDEDPLRPTVRVRGRPTVRFADEVEDMLPDEVQEVGEVDEAGLLENLGSDFLTNVSSVNEDELIDNDDIPENPLPWVNPLEKATDTPVTDQMSEEIRDAFDVDRWPPEDLSAALRSDTTTSEAPRKRRRRFDPVSGPRGVYSGRGYQAEMRNLISHLMGESGMSEEAAREYARSLRTNELYSTLRELSGGDTRSLLELLRS